MTESMATVRLRKQRGKMYDHPSIMYFCLLEVQLYLRCSESYILLSGYSMRLILQEDSSP